MKQYHVRQTENGWIVIEGSPFGMNRDYGMTGKEYVFSDSASMGAWFTRRNEEITKEVLSKSELSK